MEHFAAFILYTSQAALIACCLWVPGALILHLVLRDSWRELAGFRQLCYPIPLSLLTLAACQGLIFRASPTLVRGLVWALFLACLAFGAAALWRSRRLRIAEHYHALVVIVLVFLLAIFWLNLMTVIPGPAREGYGDLAAYYRIIDNLAEGSFPLVDFRIGELVGETYFIPLTYPVLTLTGAFFATLFSGNPHILIAVTTLIGLAGLVFCAGYLYRELRLDKAGSSQLAMLSLGLLPLLPMENGFQFVLGAITLPLLTMGLMLWDLVWSQQRLSIVQRVGLAIPCAIAMVFSRPEGLLFVALLAGFGVPWLLLRLFLAGSVRRRVAIAVLAAGLATATILGPYDRILGKSPSMLYLHYQEVTDDFRYHRIPSVVWFHVMHDNARMNYGHERQDTHENPELWSQIQAHPGAFVRWLWKTLVLQMGPSSLLIVGACSLLLLASRSVPGLIATGITWAFVIALAAINPAFFPRHTMPVRTLLLIVAFGALSPALRAKFSSPLSRRVTASPILLLALPLLILGLILGHEARRIDAESAYNSIIQILEPVIDSTSLVAMSYPTLLSYSLDVESVGNVILDELVEPVVARHSPDFIVFDDTRADMPKGYREGKRLVEEGLATKLGYQVLADVREEYFLILQKAGRQLD